VTDADRRDENRTPIELKVSYKRVNSFFADYTRNISRGGTFIATARPLAMGTEFIFALEVPGLEEPLRLNGRVIWTTEPENSTRANPAGMGIEFQYVDQAERRETEIIVENLLTKELGEELTRDLLGRAPSAR
jgi:type IV pilus assembly protein PilZ